MSNANSFEIDNNQVSVWVLVDGEIITGVASSRNQARMLKQSGYVGSIHKALLTLV